MSAPNSNAYLRTKVLTASPGELRLLLIDGAIRFAEQAREAVVARDHERLFTASTRCQDILLELLSGLRPEQAPELCERLSALYTFMFRRMVDATTTRDASILDEVLGLLRYERETWQLLLQQLAAGTPAPAAPASAAPAAPPRMSVSVRG